MIRDDHFAMRLTIADAAFEATPALLRTTNVVESPFSALHLRNVGAHRVLDRLRGTTPAADSGARIEIAGLGRQLRLDVGIEPVRAVPRGTWRHATVRCHAAPPRRARRQRS
jgi:hypothetical protein